VDRREKEREITVRPDRRTVRLALVVGCGPSLACGFVAPPGATVVACNRAIEFVPARHWVWVDRVHYERSKWHRHAQRAVHVGPVEALAYAQPARLYRVARELPCAEDELFLAGGTLTVAAHYAVQLGVAHVVFVGCDAWGGRDRYHAWDALPLPPPELAAHREHLAKTAAGILRLAETYKHVEFRDATTGERHLPVPPVSLREV
jgi:hypothetical protein